MRTAHFHSAQRPAPVYLWMSLFVIASALSLRAAQPAPQADQSASSTSVFIDDTNFGRDPFFPRSERRKAKVVIPVVFVSNPSILLQALDGLALKGTSGLPGKRLALLNNR